MTIPLMVACTSHKARGMIIIMIHQYKLNGFNIVLDVYSGSVHCVDDLAYDIIGLYESNEQETIISMMLENMLMFKRSPDRRYRT